MTRRLLATQLWLRRAESRVWLILERAGFIELKRFSDGYLASNVGFLDTIEENDAKTPLP